MSVFILESKSEWLGKFKEYKYLVQNQLQAKIETGNGTEYFWGTVCIAKMSL